MGSKETVDQVSFEFQRESGPTFVHTYLAVRGWWGEKTAIKNQAVKLT